MEHNQMRNIARVLTPPVTHCSFSLPTAAGHNASTNVWNCHTPRGEACHCHPLGDPDTNLACLNNRPIADPDPEPEPEPEIETWRGLTVTDEVPCETYDRSRYASISNADIHIADTYGGIFGPYEDACFDDYRDVHVEHIVAMKEAHDSGMCSAGYATRLNFSIDLVNLTIASPEVNIEKSAKDAAEWTPQFNECWFADRVIEVKRKYQLTIDTAEKEALEDILELCSANDLELAIKDECELPTDEDDTEGEGDD